MNIFEYPKDKNLLQNKLSGRKHLFNRELIESVTNIFRHVEMYKDKAIIEMTDKYDQTHLEEIELSDNYINIAVESIPLSLKTAIIHAKKNIEEVNRYLLPEKL